MVLLFFVVDYPIIVTCQWKGKGEAGREEGKDGGREGKQNFVSFLIIHSSTILFSCCDEVIFPHFCIFCITHEKYHWCRHVTPLLLELGLKIMFSHDWCFHNAMKLYIIRYFYGTRNHMVLMSITQAFLSYVVQLYSPHVNHSSACFVLLFFMLRRWTPTLETRPHHEE